MQERQAEALRTAAAQFLAREANRNNLITVTRVDMRSDGKHATIYITVLPESAEAAALKFANRNRGELGQFLLKRTKGMRVPALEFAIDLGDKNRRRIDELLHQ
ncbi:MAG: Ribosome-binding factor A [Parcubacteria group bacterium GW2011_GWA1_47_11]|nr:MAG: Ribosome-binding factor A [Parcubacteria group bacterium GW2011_GWA1_47_11]